VVQLALHLWIDTKLRAIPFASRAFELRANVGDTMSVARDGVLPEPDACFDEEHIDVLAIELGKGYLNVRSIVAGLWALRIVGRWDQRDIALGT